MNREKIRRLTAISLFCALSLVSTWLFRIRVAFLTFDAKDAVMTVGACFFGPTSAAVMACVTAFVEFLTVGSDTGLYGLLMNVLSSLAFSLPASAVYHRHRTSRGALFGLGLSILSTVGCMMGFNLLVTPAYLGVPTAQVAAMIPTLLAPFNLAKAMLNTALVLLLYKPVSVALRHAGFLAPGAKAPERLSFRRTTVIFWIIGVVLAAGALLLFFFPLGGTLGQ